MISKGAERKRKKRDEFIAKIEALLQEENAEILTV